MWRGPLPAPAHPHSCIWSHPAGSKSPWIQKSPAVPGSPDCHGADSTTIQNEAFLRYRKRRGLPGAGVPVVLEGFRAGWGRLRSPPSGCTCRCPDHGLIGSRNAFRTVVFPAFTSTVVVRFWYPAFTSVRFRVPAGTLERYWSVCPRLIPSR